MEHYAKAPQLFYDGGPYHSKTSPMKRFEEVCLGLSETSRIVFFCKNSLLLKAHKIVNYFREKSSIMNV